MAKISTIIYSTKQGIKGIGRNRMFSLASIGTMTACLFLFGIFYFILANFRYMLKSAETNVQVKVFFDSNITSDDVSNIGIMIMNRPEVQSTRYISAEEAWEDYKEKYITKEMADSFGNDNPLKDSASYVVYLNDVSKQNDLVRYINNIKGVRQVYDSEKAADFFGEINVVVTYVSAAIIIILLCVAAFLISTTVTMGISIRKQEISIMKLIGATDFFIRAPFVVEGLLIGVIGALIPIGVLNVIYKRLQVFIVDRFGGGMGSEGLLEQGAIFKVLVPISLGIGIGIGFIGSYSTVKRQLKRIE